MSTKTTETQRRSNRNAVANNTMHEPFNVEITLTRVADRQSVVDVAGAQHICQGIVSLHLNRCIRPNVN